MPDDENEEEIDEKTAKKREEQKQKARQFVSKLEKDIKLWNISIDATNVSQGSSLPNPMAILNGIKLLTLTKKIKQLPKVATADPTLVKKIPKITKDFAVAAAKVPSMLSTFFINLVNTIVNIVVSAWPVVLVGLALIVIIVVLVVLMGWLFGLAGGGSIAGITGDDFYGVRTWYRNTEQSRIILADQYIDLLDMPFSEGFREDIEDDGEATLTLEDGVVLTITISEELLEEKLSYTSYTGEGFATDYPALAEYLDTLADTMYTADNEGETAPETLDEKLDGIKYFGYGEGNLLTLEELVDDYIAANYTVTAGVDGEGEPIADATDRFNSWLDSTTFLDATANPNLAIRTEKLFVKDYLLSGEQSMLKDIERQDYVGFQFMPREEVTFYKLSFFTIYMTEGFEMHAYNNGDDLGLSHTESLKNEIESGEIIQYTYETWCLQSVEAFDYMALPSPPSTDTGREESSEDAVELGLTVYDLALNPTTQGNMLELVEGIYQLKENNGLVCKFTNPTGETFMFVEVETDWI